MLSADRFGLGTDHAGVQWTMKSPIANNTVGRFLTLLARLDGYLNRKRDAPPGNMVLRPGMARLNDIHLGYFFARDVGN